MSLGEISWILFLAGLPFAPLINQKLDLWHGQGLWASLWIGLLFGLSIFTGQKKLTTGNKPLAAWLILTFIWVLWSLTKGIMVNKQYNLALFLPMLHILSIVLFCFSANNTWSRSFIERLMKAIAISASVLVAYGLCQAVGFDPIFKDLDASKKTHEVVGLIGNPSHFGIYLAVILPIFWAIRTSHSYLTQLGIWSLLIILLFRNASVSGILSATLASIVWWLYHNKKAAIGIGSLLVLAITLLYFNDVADAASIRMIMTDSGRLATWEALSKLIGKSPLFGLGPGALSFISQSFTGPLTGWRHAHNEFLQLTIEQGLAGLAILGWFLYDLAQRVLKLEAEPLVPALASVITAFLFSSFLSYPAHLWMIGSVGLFAICAINVLSEKSCP